MAFISTTVLNQLAADQSDLEAENQQLLSWGIGATKVANLTRYVVQIDTNKYKITLLSNTLEYRDDFSVAEEVLKYSLTNPTGNLDATYRFREDHLSRYQLATTESTPILTQNPPSSILDTAKAALERYRAYSGDAYLQEMSALLSTVNQIEDPVTTAVSGNMKLQITQTGSSVEFLWMHSEKGIDFSAKSLRMTFDNRILTALTDGYFLFTVGNADLNINQNQAITIAENHLKTLTWTINGTQTSAFTANQTISTQMLPHPRSNSVALVPYWYIVLQLDKTYSGGINQAAVGIYADTGEVADVQLLSR